MFYKALRIRLIEEKVIEIYPTDLIQSPVHLSIGQEQIAVGLCQNLSSNDWVFINYRSHAFYLAKNGDLRGFFCELMGRANGVCGGKGGSMHLADPEKGIMGASAVVGSTISHAVGAAFAEKIKNENRIFVSVFGDGATEQGSLHESLNLAALWKVPVVFLCEDNDLAVHSSKVERQAYVLEDLVNAYNIPYFYESSGFDFEKVFSLFNSAINLVRKTKAPVFVHVKTARYKEHVGPGEDFDFGFRKKSELSDWFKRDPLLHDQKLISEYSSKIKKEIEDAVNFAINSPFPSHEELFTHV